VIKQSPIRGLSCPNTAEKSLVFVRSNIKRLEDALRAALIDLENAQDRVAQLESVLKHNREIVRSALNEQAGDAEGFLS